MAQPSPNALGTAWSMLAARRVARPAPRGRDVVDHDAFGTVLQQLAAAGMRALPDQRPGLTAYLARMSSVDPDRLDRNEALAYWLNVYNAAALDLTADAQRRGADSVLRLPGAFSAKRVDVGGERLSLDGIEHGKVRRFRDPRVHAALVCGSVSCPTLAAEPYRGEGLDGRLDEQMRRALADGGATTDRSAGLVTLSRIFLWFGADFTRPGRMPTILPARRSKLLRSLAAWMTPDDAAWVLVTRPQVAFGSYDWGIACAVG